MTTAPINQFTLCLSEEGNAVKITNFNQDGAGATMPEQVEALACKTHQEVLAFLEKLSHSETRNQLDFYHRNNTSYDRHIGTWPKGVAHLCTLEQQIDFVRYKIGETTHGVRHEPKSFCAIQ